jgi:MFS family permease
LIGIGMGLSSTAFIVSIQSTVGWQKRGIATASNMFMRTLGSTIGAALLGGILNSRLTSYIKNKGLSDQANIDTVNSLLDEKQRNQLPVNVTEVLQNGLTAALHNVYWVVLIFAFLSLLFIFFFPKNNPRLDEE